MFRNLKKITLQGGKYLIINKQEIISEFASKAGDVGSSKVQIAILTKKN